MPGRSFQERTRTIETLTDIRVTNNGRESRESKAEYVSRKGGSVAESKESGKITLYLPKRPAGRGKKLLGGKDHVHDSDNG